MIRNFRSIIVSEAEVVFENEIAHLGQNVESKSKYFQNENLVYSMPSLEFGSNRKLEEGPLIPPNLKYHYIEQIPLDDFKFVNKVQTIDHDPGSYKIETIDRKQSKTSRSRRNNAISAS